MKRRLILFFTILLFASPSVAYTVEGFPGSTWSDLHLETPSGGESNLIFEGWVRQGIAWKSWKKKDVSLLLNTYLTARYKWDSERNDFNNYLGPGAGVALELSSPHGPLISWGVEYIHQLNYDSGDTAPYTALFMNWYHWWDVKDKGYPGSTWGDVRWEIPDSGTRNLIVEGWVRQGIEWKRWERGRNSFILDPYAKIRYKWDSRGLDWNNYIGPGAGISIDMESQKGPLVSWGVEYSWEKNLRSGSDAHRVDVFMRWYAWWDLKKTKSGE